MFGLFDGHAIDMVDLFTDLIVAPAVRLAREGEIVVGEIQPLRHHQLIRGQCLWQIGDHGFGRGGIQIAFAHHHPAHIFQHGFIPLVHPGGAHIDHTGFAVGVLFEADHFGLAAQGVAGPDRGQPAPLGITQIGHRIERDIRHGFAKDDVKSDQIIQRAGRQAAVFGELVGGIKRMPRGVEHMIKRPFAPRHGARHRVVQYFAQAVVFEKAPCVGLGHQCAPNLVSGV